MMQEGSLLLTRIVIEGGGRSIGEAYAVAIYTNWMRIIRMVNRFISMLCILGLYSKRRA